MATVVPPRSTTHEQAVINDTLGSYARGWFPMFDYDTDVIHWVQPRKRGIIPVEEDRFIVSRSLRSVVRSGRFKITADRAFGRVIQACGELTKKRKSTWLHPSIVEVFELLHQAGHAHSVEAWLDGELVGGLYGVAVGSVFCGESMFSRPELGGSNASKVCLVHLVEHMRAQEFSLLDAQLSNPHLEQFGCYEMDGGDYGDVLFIAARDGREWGVFPET